MIGQIFYGSRSSTDEI